MRQPPLDTSALRAEMNLDGGEIDRRKDRLRLGDEDFARMRSLGALVEPHVATIADALVEELLVEGDGSAPDRDRARALLGDYFREFTNSDGFSDAFVDRRLAMVDRLRAQVCSDVGWYLAAYQFFLQQVAALLRHGSGDVTEGQTAYRTLAKVVFMDLSLTIDAYIFERNRTIRAQQHELEMLSTPVLQLREGLLILPIVGTLDSRRAQQLTEQLLQAIRDRRGKVVVLDVTGVAAVDSRVANHLIQTVDAARLMGAKAIVTGLSPEVAQTLVGLGINLGGVTTLAELQDGVEEADRTLGLQVVTYDGTPAQGGPA